MKLLIEVKAPTEAVDVDGPNGTTFTYDRVDEVALAHSVELVAQRVAAGEFTGSIRDAAGDTIGKYALIMTYGPEQV